MKYERFEDLSIWKAAMDLAHSVYRLTHDRFFTQRIDLRNQLRHAALSVSNNIAEGFERGSTAELIVFLSIARGSAGEVRSMLHFVDRSPEADHLKSDVSNLTSVAESCSRHIRSWTEKLISTDIKSQHFLSNQTQSKLETNLHPQEFHQQIHEVVKNARGHNYIETEKEL